MDHRDLFSVLDALLDGVILLDASGRVAHLSAEACRILEMSAEKGVGSKLTDLLDVTETELKRVAAMKDIDTGIASIYRTVQGIGVDEEGAEVKQELMKSIFEANLALLGKPTSE